MLEFGETMASDEVAPENGAATGEHKVLTETDAVEIWIARWLRVRPKHLVSRYGCDSRRLYEIWWGERFPGSKAKAEKQFRERYPGVVERTAFGYRRIPTVVAKRDGARQLSLFD